MKPALLVLLTLLTGVSTSSCDAPGAGDLKLSSASPIIGNGRDQPLTLPVASKDANGYLSAEDWATFSNKVDPAQLAAGTKTLIDRLAIAEGEIASLKEQLAKTPKVSWGTYTPTVTDITNTSSRKGYPSQWLSVGNVVTVSGYVDVTATANQMQTAVDIELPIRSAFKDAPNLGGTAGMSPEGVTSVIIAHNQPPFGAAMYFNSVTTAPRGHAFNFTYVVF